MKKTIVLIVVLILAGLVLAGWDEIPRQKANPDIATFLIPVPADVIDLHGNTDRTKVMYNIAFLRQVCANYEKQIKALETSVADLTKRVTKLEDDMIMYNDKPVIVIAEKGIPGDISIGTSEAEVHKSGEASSDIIVNPTAVDKLDGPISFDETSEVVK